MWVDRPPLHHQKFTPFILISSSWTHSYVAVSMRNILRVYLCSHCLRVGYPRISAPSRSNRLRWFKLKCSCGLSHNKPRCGLMTWMKRKRNETYSNLLYFIEYRWECRAIFPFSRRLHSRLAYHRSRTRCMGEM